MHNFYGDCLSYRVLSAKSHGLTKFSPIKNRLKCNLETLVEHKRPMQSIGAIGRGGAQILVIQLGILGLTKG